jgi:hypothetical protein
VKNEIGLEIGKRLPHRAFIAGVDIGQPVSLVFLDLDVGRENLCAALLEVRIDSVAQHAAASGDQYSLVVHWLKVILQRLVLFGRPLRYNASNGSPYTQLRR